MDARFDELDSNRPFTFEDKYTDSKVWVRSLYKSLEVMQNLEKNNINTNNMTVLEFGCGDGMVGYQFHTGGFDIEFLDIEDWRKERAKAVPLRIHDITLDIDVQKKFDLIYSFDTFEHILNPFQALVNFKKILNDDGHIYLSFVPLYYSAYGMHLHNIFNIPFPQLIFSESFLKNKIKERGIKDLGRDRIEIQPLNKFKLEDYLEAVSKAGFEVVSLIKGKDLSQAKFIFKHTKFLKREHLTLDDLILNSVKILLKKKPVNERQ
jgi:SAM-dependent methyltransferase